MKDDKVKALIELRKYLIQKFDRCRDYKTNQNAIMKEVDHAKVIHKTIVDIDTILKEYVDFS